MRDCDDCTAAKRPRRGVYVFRKHHVAIERMS
ncbi:MAG: hypothetical protein QOH51_1040 [Acidobacteriota bacterium]|jgi:hypothetical protein|nr:hypothetical protein [Acidobacteriota bacterium]